MEDSDEEVALMALAYIKLKKRRNKRKHRWWVHPAIQQRSNEGYTTSLIPVLMCEDSLAYKNFLRVTSGNFEKLLGKIVHVIRKEDTSFRTALTPELRLQVTLRCLATGEKFSSLNWQFNCGRTTVGKIVQETCKAIWDCLSPTYLKFPQEPHEWLNIADEFNNRWQIPHCVGAIDGKHVRMICPQKSGSLNYNYKHYFSKVLFAVAGADYRFIYVDVGNYGSEGDSGILSKSLFGKKMESGHLNLPPPSLLPGSNKLFPYFFVGDQAFPLKIDLMRPYKGKLLNGPQKIFNYRLCRGRRIVENAFGILSNRFRLYHTELQASETTNNLMVLASLALHNFLLTEQKDEYCPHSLCDHENVNDDFAPVSGTWREDPANLIPHQIIGSANYSRHAENLRENLAMYFMSDSGQVSWQGTAVDRGYYAL